MKKREQRYGMVTACVGGGQGIAGIFERLQGEQNSKGFGKKSEPKGAGPKPIDARRIRIILLCRT